MGCETPCSPADKYQYYRETCYILSATLFHPEDGSNTFLCNDSTHPSHYVASHCPTPILLLSYITVHSSWNVMAHSDTQEGKWRGNWRMEWVASTLHTTSEHGVSSITTADAHTSAASSRLNWRHRRFKWTCLFWWRWNLVFPRVPSRFSWSVPNSMGYRTIIVAFLLLYAMKRTYWGYLRSNSQGKIVWSKMD